MSNPSTSTPIRLAQREPLWLRLVLIGFVFAFVGIFLVVPVVNVFYQALGAGWPAYAANFIAAPPVDGTALPAIAREAQRVAARAARYNRDAIKTTLLVAAIVVPLNTLFGIAAAWLTTRFRLRGRGLLLTLIDLPFSVSPVIAGLLFVLIFGMQGVIQNTLERVDPSVRDHIVGVTSGHYQTPDWPRATALAAAGHPADPFDLPMRPMSASEEFFGWLGYLNSGIIFHLAGIVLATLFVTFPFVARELIPMMDAQGSDEEVAALTLGAGGWQIFRRITLVNIKWGLLYGLVLCNARTMGEFGAVNVVSGNIRGQNTTLPLRIQQLYEDYNTSGAFALATLLASLALVTLLVKTWLEWKSGLPHTAPELFSAGGAARGTEGRS